MQEWLGTRTTADLNLVAQALMLAGLWVGFRFARTRQRTRHKNMQTGVVLAQLFFIFFVMVTSFYNYVVEGGTTTGTVAYLMMVHGSLGLIAEGSGIYLVLRMRTQVIPPRYRIRNFKLLMRATLGLWTVIAVLGFGVYYYRYLAPRAVAATAPLTQLCQAGDDLVMHALELRDAVDRDNLQTARRHAEHLVNLIEGSAGPNYGDLDGDGAVEDPGDGTGLLSYLVDVQGATSDRDVAALIEAVRPRVEQVNGEAARATRAGALGTVKAFAAELLSTADKANGRIADIDARARDAGVTPTTVSAAAVPGASGEPNTVTVVMDRFQFADSTVTIKRGWTVVWVNSESPKHTATADEGAFNSGSMARGDTFSFTFEETGTFPYYCRFHGDSGGVDMAGTIVVE